MTVGKTTISTATVIEHAVRRCGISPEKQTPDVLKLARENLFFLFASYGNRGVPLWCVQKQFLPTVENKFQYKCLPGTVDILSVNLRTFTGLISTDTVGTTTISSDFGLSSRPVMFGITSSADHDLSLLIEYSDDSITWTQLGELHEISVQVDQQYWVELTETVSAQYYRVTEQTLADADFTAITWMDSYTDRIVTRMSLDQYYVLPNKHSNGIPVQYLYDRQVTPELYVWPVPSDSSSLLQVIFQQQVSDVGLLTDTLDIPNRWLEATIWQLAKRLVLSIPGIEPTTKQIVLQQAAENQIEVEAEDVDNAPVMVQPAIDVYTR